MTRERKNKFKRFFNYSNQIILFLSTFTTRCWWWWNTMWRWTSMSFFTCFLNCQEVVLFISWILSSCKQTFRVDRPLETVSFVLIRFVDELDGDTSTMPDVLLCSFSWCTGVVDNDDSAVWFKRRELLLLPFAERLSGVVERARLFDS